MIILAAAVILSLNSSNIVNKANKARSLSDAVSIQEAASVKLAEYELAKATGSETRTAKQYIEDEFSMANGYNADYYANTKGVIIGTKHKEGITTVPIPLEFTKSAVDTEDEISEGLVISDSEGNEFVWVPVDNIIEFERKAGYYDGILQSLEDYTEPYENGYPTEVADYNAMKDSVAEHKGFYIVRYEAGSETERTYHESVDSNGTTKMVVKKGAYLYNYVGWGPSMTRTTGDVINEDNMGQNEGKGAVQLSKEMYAGSSSVESHLTYGVEWDTALKFIDPSFTGYAKNSSGQGNYTGSLKNTGYYSVKNIYDMAGNAMEWTMEVYPFYDKRVYRGGTYYINGSSYPASYREYDVQAFKAAAYLGFRVSLYIK